MKMTKITIDKETFKALASDARLEILKTLDGRKMNLSEISRKTNLNKATVHEHLTKLVGAGLVKKIEREGHKWTYYKLSWKGSNLLHPENTKIVVMFSLAFVLLINGIIQLIWYAKGTLISLNEKFFSGEAIPQAEEAGGRLFVNFPYNKSSIPDATSWIHGNETTLGKAGETSNATFIPHIYAFIQDPLFLYVGIASIAICIALLLFATWRLWKNRIPAL